MLRRIVRRWANRLTAGLSFLRQEVSRAGLWRSRRPSDIQTEAANFMADDLLKRRRQPVELDAGCSGRIAS